MEGEAREGSSSFFYAGFYGIMKPRGMKAARKTV